MFDDQLCGSRKVKVTILASEWGSRKGGLSTINRELALQLAKCPEVEITFFLPQCSQEDRKVALQNNVKIVEATPLPGFEQLDWLCFPPDHLQIDIIVGQGVKLGKQAQFIKESKKCKWLQVVHTDPEEFGMFKNYSNPISKGEEKRKTEVELCKMADHVLGVGPKLSEAFRTYLRSCRKDDTVLEFTPGVFEEFAALKQVRSERQQRSVLVFGRGDVEDFKLKGFDIAGKAIAALEDTRLVFVGAPDGKHEEIAKWLTKCGVPERHLRVRGFVKERESLKDLFREVDLLIMPSRTEGFGLTGLEALSAGLPVLVSSNTGFGEALCSVPFGAAYVINSDEPAHWTLAIRKIWAKDRKNRLEEAEMLRDSFDKKYSWARQIKDLIEKMISWVYDDSSNHQGYSETKHRKVSQQMEGVTENIEVQNILPSVQNLQCDADKVYDKTILPSNLRTVAAKKGFLVSDNQASGDCLFYALSEQLKSVKGIQISCKELRNTLVQFLRENTNRLDGTTLFNFVSGYPSWREYLQSMAKEGTWGDHVVLFAAANHFQTAIRIISSLDREIVVHPEHAVADPTPLVLGHIHELHYVSLQPRKGSAELTAHALCQVTRKNEKDWGSTEIMKIQQEPKEGMQALALVPVTSPWRTSVTTAYLDVHIDCDSMTGPGLPGRGVPSAQEVLDYIRFKFYKSVGRRELEEVKSEEQNVQRSDVTTCLEEECSTVIEPGPHKRDTGIGHYNRGDESITSAKLADALPKLEMGETTSPSSPFHKGADAKKMPVSQEFFNFVARKYLTTVNPATLEEFNEFVEYMEKARKVILVDFKTGSLIITAECSSLEILDELWKAHCTGTLNKMAQSLVTEDVLKTFGLTEVKLITTIVEEEYEACREVFLKEGAEPSERPETQASNRDSDDDERDCDSNKLKGHLENPRQMQQETNEDISKEPSTSRGPGDLPGDLVSAVSGYSSFPSKEVTPLDPECLLKAEDDSPASDTDNSPWPDKNVLSSILTSKGGVVDGEGVRLVYPPGAVESPVNVNITFEDPSKYDGFLIRKDLENDVMFGAPILNLQPNGYFFKKPVTLTTKFAIQGMKCSDVLVMHGTDAVVGKSIWEDITENTQIDVENQDVTIVIGHFSRIVVLLKCTWSRPENIRFRFNSRAFHYTFLVLKKSFTSSEEVEREGEEELALLFVSQDVYHEQFYKKQEASALVQLKKERFVQLHVRRIDSQPRRRIYHNEILRLEIHIGKDYEVVEEKKELDVKSSNWWKAGEVVRVPLKVNQDVRSLCGTITVQGEYGHISTWHFSEKVSDLCGYVRSLLGVEDAIFNLVPIARSLDMPDEVMKQVTKCWKDESKQLNIILKHWSAMEKNMAEDVDALRRNLEKLKQGFADQASYKVTERGQMLIRNLRELATKNAEAGLFHFCSTLLRDLCIEMESSAEGVEKAALSTNSAEYFLVNHSNENHLSSANRRPIPQDVASKYRQLFSLPNKPCLKTLLAITPYLIQNIKEIYVDCESTEPQNGLKGLSKEKVDHFVADVEKAEQEEDYEGLIFLICRVLEKLSKKNVKDPVLLEIEEMSESLEIRQMLKPLKRFFQHSRQDIRLHMRLHLFSRRLRDTLTKRAEREKIDVFPLHNVRNMLLSLLCFAKHDPSKIVRFELTDAINFPLSCYPENVTYNKPEATYSQMFRVKKESEEVLQLHAVALVHIEEDKERKKREIEQREKGSFQSEIVLHASDERAFDRCMRRHPNIAVLKLKDKRSGNLRMILCSRQQEKLFNVKIALERKLRLDFKTSKITWYGLKMASIESETGAFLSLRLVYKWGSERVVLDSKDFVTLANCSVGGPAFSETGQAAESSIMNPVSDEEHDATPSDTDSSGKQEKRKTDSATDDTDPPEVIVPQLKSKDLPGRSESLDDRRLPVDILLLTVEDWEFLSCLSYLSRGFGRFYHSELGPVYLGKMGDGMKLNIAIMKCCKGSSVLVVKNAVKVLGPRAVFAVGSCSGLDCKNVKVGDVVVLDKLITYGPSKVTENGIEELGVKVPLKPRLSKLTTAAGDGWKPPLKDTEALEVKIHRGAFLSGQEVVDSPERCRALIKRFRGAVAIEGEGEGVYAAAHDLDIEWIVIKGISNFADGRKIKGSWRTFASLMAASLTAHILSDTIVFHDFPHYGRSSKEKNREDNSGMKSCNQVRQQESDTQPSLGGVNYDALRQICKMEAKGNAGKTDPSLNLKKKANEKGFEISDNRGEGNCMFFAISEQLEFIQGVKLSHRKLRKKVVRHLKKNPTLPDGTELFHFVEGYSSWNDYLKSKKADGTWGDHVILHGAAHCFETCIHVISSQPDYRDVTINPQCEDADRKRLVLGHLSELHYVSLIPRKGGAIHDALRQICKMEATGKTGKTDPSLNLKKIACEKGFEISVNQGEGNCMFFAISEQLELIQGVEPSHKKLRKKVVRYLKENPTLPDGTELFHFVEGHTSWDAYLQCMEADGTWGDHVILHGAANCFNTCIHVISNHHRDVLINPQREDADRDRLVLGHLYGLHYVSLIPCKSPEGTAKRQKRRLQTDEDDAHLDWGGEKKKKHKSGTKRCKQ